MTTRAKRPTDGLRPIHDYPDVQAKWASCEELTRQLEAAEARLAESRAAKSRADDAGRHALGTGRTLDDSSETRALARAAIPAAQDDILVITGAQRVAQADLRDAQATAHTELIAACRKAHEVAILTLDQALTTAAAANTALTLLEDRTAELLDVPGFGKLDGQAVVPVMSWSELRPNSSGSGRLESWRSFVEQETAIDLATAS